jgi:predicted DNA-binding protein YlxM (UPF0122 family)
MGRLRDITKVLVAAGRDDLAHEMKRATFGKRLKKLTAMVRAYQERIDYLEKWVERNRRYEPTREILDTQNEIEDLAEKLLRATELTMRFIRQG